MQAFFGVVGPTENGGECKEYKRNGEEVRGNYGAARDNGEAAGKCFHRDVHAFKPELRVPCARDYDGKAGHRTNDNRIEERARHANETLTYRFLCLCCSGCNRSRTEACFVTEDAAGNTFLHSDKDGADCTARDCGWIECGFDNRFDSA